MNVKEWCAKWLVSIKNGRYKRNANGGEVLPSKQNILKQFEICITS